MGIIEFTMAVGELERERLNIFKELPQQNQFQVGVYEVPLRFQRALPDRTWARTTSTQQSYLQNFSI